MCLDNLQKVVGAKWYRLPSCKSNHRHCQIQNLALTLKSQSKGWVIFLRYKTVTLPIPPT
jgi:hypothetical protein